MIARILFANLFLFAIAGPAAADDKAKEKEAYFKEYYEKYGQPGPEHKLLEPLAGTWNARVRMYTDEATPPSESEGTVTRSPILGGRFLREEFSGTFMGQPFQGVGVIGYDRAKKAFTNNWADTLSTQVMHSSGQYDEAAKSFTLTANETCPVTNQPVQTRDIIQIVNADEQKMTMYRKMGNEKESKCMEIVLTRKK